MAVHSPKGTIPLYSRMASIIQNKIVSGQYGPGERLPTEDEMVELYDVSKITVRNAMAVLEANGLIIRTRGRGTFVTDKVPKTQKIIHTSLDEILISIAGSRIKPLEIRTMPVNESRIPRDICVFFGMTIADSIGRIQRLVTHKGVSSFFENYMPPDIAKYITKKELVQKKSVQKILKEKIGLKVTRAEMVLQAVPAEQDISAILQCETFEPLIHIQACFWYHSGLPFEIVNRYFRACNFQYKMKLDIS